MLSGILCKLYFAYVLSVQTVFDENYRLLGYGSLIRVSDCTDEEAWLLPSGNVDFEARRVMGWGD